MTLKVKLFIKSSQHEVDDPDIMIQLQRMIEQVIETTFSAYSASVRLYGELIIIKPNDGKGEVIV